MNGKFASEARTPLEEQFSLFVQSHFIFVSFLTCHRFGRVLLLSGVRGDKVFADRRLHIATPYTLGARGVPTCRVVRGNNGWHPGREAREVESVPGHEVRAKVVTGLAKEFRSTS